MTHLAGESSLQNQKKATISWTGLRQIQTGVGQRVLRGGPLRVPKSARVPRFARRQDSRLQIWQGGLWRYRGHVVHRANALGVRRMQAHAAALRLSSDAHLP